MDTYLVGRNLGRSFLVYRMFEDPHNFSVARVVVALLIIYACVEFVSTLYVRIRYRRQLSPDKSGH